MTVLSNLMGPSPAPVPSFSLTSKHDETHTGSRTARIGLSYIHTNTHIFDTYFHTDSGIPKGAVGAGGAHAPGAKFRGQ